MYIRLDDTIWKPFRTHVFSYDYRPNFTIQFSHNLATVRVKENVCNAA
jgi:hypothetical protein